MASETDDSIKTEVKRTEATTNISISKGAWTPEEDRKLAEVIRVQGAKRWNSIAVKAGLNRCGKSCRLRWLNYLRPNIKRGNISDQEEDLILRLHKLLGNRWSLIAGRLPGRTDNEIKNYWNSHLSKKIKLQSDKQSGSSTREEKQRVVVVEEEILEETSELIRDQENSTEEAEEPSSKPSFDGDRFFGFSEEEEGPLNLEWVSHFLELDEPTIGVFSQ